MSTTDAGGSRRQGQQTGLWRVRWPVMLVLLASAMTGCSGGEAQPRNGSPDPVAPTHGTDTPIPQHKLDKLAGFLDKTKFLDRIGRKFELSSVTYTSPSDAVAEFLDNRVRADDRGSVIATTNDNWTHGSRLFINDDLADLVDYVPLGRGAVAIKARDQLRGKSYPPFVLYPDGTVKPMHIAEPRALDADSELLKSHRGFLVEIGLEELTGYKIGGREPTGLWAADVDAGEIFQVVESPFGQVLEHVPGRDGEILSVAGYQRNVGDGVWRFETSTDAGQSWRRTDIRLPLGRRPIWRYADNALHAVGPGHMQAIAMADYLQDAPMLLRELWLTDDEQEFRRVPLPWDRTLFGGIAFASDGALLLSEVTGPVTYCDALVCNRAGRIWRLAPGGTEMKRLPSAPRLFGPFWAVGIDFSGGSIIARTGLRSIALSVDGYTWIKVTPG